MTNILHMNCHFLNYGTDLCCLNPDQYNPTILSKFCMWWVVQAAGQSFAHVPVYPWVQSIFKLITNCMGRNRCNFVTILERLTYRRRLKRIRAWTEFLLTSGNLKFLYVFHSFYYTEETQVFPGTYTVISQFALWCYI